MNAGAYDGEIKDIIIYAKALDKNLNTIELSSNDLDLGYRKSSVYEKGYILLSGTFQLHHGNKHEILKKIQDFN